MFNFHHKDNDFCRAYYRNTEGGLYCIQDNGDLGVEFLRCSSDGEPEYPLTMPEAKEFDKFVLPGDKKMKTFDVNVNAEVTDPVQATVTVQATTAKEAVAQVRKSIEDGETENFEFSDNGSGSGYEGMEVDEDAIEVTPW